MPSNDNDWERLVQADRVHRNVYIEPAIFSLEMDRVFAGSWVYLLHESEIPTTNDFRQVWLGTRELVAARGEDGGIHVFFNRCSHRGATVCREHQGNASHFTCPYHGWRFDNRGQLFAIPARNAYGPVFKSRDMHLARPAQVASYNGFVFATLNPDASPLADHLGSSQKTENKAR
ncbi:aromatic ring-hydroxylating oxygenase subunit alpha [Herbaspirillum chlorophenolicum]|nr:Rieske (2Fe-2S) protein [Herbaspirillum chlorophenolicum]